MSIRMFLWEDLGRKRCEFIAKMWENGGLHGGRWLVECIEVLRWKGGVGIVSVGYTKGHVGTLGIVDESTGMGLFMDLLRALEYCHGKGIVHRNVRRECLYLRKGFNGSLSAVLGNFWSATKVKEEEKTKKDKMSSCWRSSKKSSTSKKAKSIKMDYEQQRRMPPEQHDSGKWKPSGDMWAAGIILYEMLTGKFPFKEIPGDNIDETHSSTPKNDNIQHSQDWSPQHSSQSSSSSLLASYPSCSIDYTTIDMTGAASNLSPPAKDLITCLLSVNPSTRLTATEALTHPFITQQRPVALGERRESNEGIEEHDTRYTETLDQDYGLLGVEHSGNEKVGNGDEDYVEEDQNIGDETIDARMGSSGEGEARVMLEVESKMLDQEENTMQGGQLGQLNVVDCCEKDNGESKFVNGKLISEEKKVGDGQITQDVAERDAARDHHGENPLIATSQNIQAVTTILGNGETPAKRKASPIPITEELNDNIVTSEYDLTPNRKVQEWKLTQDQNAEQVLVPILKPNTSILHEYSSSKNRNHGLNDELKFRPRKFWADNGDEEEVGAVSRRLVKNVEGVVVKPVARRVSIESRGEEEVETQEAREKVTVDYRRSEGYQREADNGNMVEETERREDMIVSKGLGVLEPVSLANVKSSGANNVAGVPAGFQDDMRDSNMAIHSGTADKEQGTIDAEKENVAVDHDRLCEDGSARTRKTNLATEIGGSCERQETMGSMRTMAAVEIVKVKKSTLDRVIAKEETSGERVDVDPQTLDTKYGSSAVRSEKEENVVVEYHRGEINDGLSKVQTAEMESASVRLDTRISKETKETSKLSMDGERAIKANNAMQMSTAKKEDTCNVPGFVRKDRGFVNHTDGDPEKVVPEGRKSLENRSGLVKRTRAGVGTIERRRKLETPASVDANVLDKVTREPIVVEKKTRHVGLQARNGHHGEAREMKRGKAIGFEKIIDLSVVDTQKTIGNRSPGRSQRNKKKNYNGKGGNRTVVVGVVEDSDDGMDVFEEIARGCREVLGGSMFKMDYMAAFRMRLDSASLSPK